MPIQNRRRKRARGPLIQGKVKVILIGVLSVLVLVVMLFALRPENQLMNTPEMQTAHALGALRVGVREGLPGFSQGNEGLDIDLARALCMQIFPESEPDVALELVPVTQFTGRPKLLAGEIDLLLGVQWDTASEDFAYSGVYYRENIVVLCRPGDGALPLAEQTIALIESSAENSAWNTRNQELGEIMTKPRYYASYPDLLQALISGRENFIALPQTQLVGLDTTGLERHSELLGTVGYVAVSYFETPAFAQMTDVVIADLEDSDQLSSMARSHGLPVTQ